MTPPAGHDRRAPLTADGGRISIPDESLAGVWSAGIEYFRLGHPELYRGWFPRVRPGRLSSGVLTLVSENEAQKAYLEAHCRDALTMAVQRSTGRLISLDFSSTRNDVANPTRNAQVSSLDPWQTFDSFATGPCNRLAHAAATTLATNPEPAFRLLFLHGPAGAGKTHLLQALGHVAASSNRNGLCLVSCDRFCREWIEAVEGGREAAFRRTFREIDWLLVDDVDQLASRARSQEEFFHTLNALQNLPTRIAVAATSPPEQLTDVEKRLRDRFSAGFVVPLDPPCGETRRAIVHSLARTRCIEITDAVVSILAEPEGCSAADLASALTWLNAQSQTAGGRITEGLARDWFDSWRRPLGVSESMNLK